MLTSGVSGTATCLVYSTVLFYLGRQYENCVVYTGTDLCISKYISCSYDSWRYYTKVCENTIIVEI
jgi:hypothetical protein